MPPPLATWMPAAPPVGSVGSQVTSIVTSTVTSPGSGDTLAYDAYNDVAGTALPSHVGDSGVTYSRHPQQTGGGSNAQIGTSNDILWAGFNAGAGLEYIAYANPASEDYSSAMSFVLFSSTAGSIDGIGIGVRYDLAALTRALLFWNALSVAWELYSTRTGSDRLLGSISTLLPVTTSNPRKVRLAAQGNGSRVTYTATVDDVDIMVVADTHAERITSVGQPGMRFFQSAAGAGNNSKLHMDNLLVKTLTSIVTSTTTSIATSAVSVDQWNGAGAPTTTWQS